VSRDATHTTPTADQEQPALPDDGAPRPLSPTFTATVDQSSGAIRARGHVDGPAADLLGGTIVALQRQGHRHIVVRMRPMATADAEARELLAALTERLAADGTRLVVE